MQYEEKKERNYLILHAQWWGGGEKARISSEPFLPLKNDLYSLL